MLHGSLNKYRFILRGRIIMLDFHVAQLFDVSTQQLNQLAKRHRSLFPPQLYFRLNKTEYERLRATDGLAQMQFRNHAHFPHAFTMGGVNMVGICLKNSFADRLKLILAVKHPAYALGPVLQSRVQAQNTTTPKPAK